VDTTTNFAPVPSITARPSREEKERFAELAAKTGLSESALAVIAIRRLLASEDMDPRLPSCDTKAPATDRITIRLRPGDAGAIAERAARKGIKASMYLAGLIRAHVFRSPPLAPQELAALKDVVVVLTSVRQHLARLTQELRATGRVPEGIAEHLRQTRHVVDEAESIACALARAALRSWESPYG